MSLPEIKLKNLNDIKDRGGFRWLQTDGIENIGIKTIKCDGGMCYLLEMNIDYPKLHDNHNDYPLVVEKQARSSIGLLDSYLSRLKR